jgi:hypothetical protein
MKWPNTKDMRFSTKKQFKLDHMKLLQESKGKQQIQRMIQKYM